MPDDQKQPMGRGKKTTLAATIAVAIAAPAEGLRHYVYSDPVGIPTYCFGETKNPISGKFYSTEECKTLLNDRMLEAVLVVDRCLPNLPPQVLGAFGSAVYNMGPTIACNTTASTAARLLKGGQYVQACNELPKWDKAGAAGVLITLPGLTKRRATERDACLQGLNAS